MTKTPNLPIIDLSPFIKDEEDEVIKKKTIELIGHACSEYGFFQLVNHGIPIEAMNKALKLYTTFFSFPHEEKLKYSPKPDAPLPVGYTKPPEDCPNKNEYFVMLQPGSGFNVYPPGFREVVDDMFLNMVKLGRIIESIINEFSGLPPNFLKEYNNDRNSDALTIFHYFPATEMDNTGLFEHKDLSIITFVLQDDTGGLEFYKDGKWIPISPLEGALVVNLGDVIQVLSNDKLKSPTHRVVTKPEKDRYSHVFSFMIGADKWVEPLPQSTKDIDEAPKYRGFVFSEYLQLRFKEVNASEFDDVKTIRHYAI